jgi:hypothetical protein
MIVGGGACLAFAARAARPSARLQAIPLYAVVAVAAVMAAVLAARTL